MEEKRYAIHPGWGYSQDGDRHYIGYFRLIELYKLNPKECIRWDDFAGRRWNDYVHLYAESDGNYQLYSKPQQ